MEIKEACSIEKELYAQAHYSMTGCVNGFQRIHFFWMLAGDFVFHKCRNPL